MYTSDQIHQLLQQKIDQYKGVITPEVLNLIWLGMVETRETGKHMEGTHQEWVKTTSLFHDLVKISLSPNKK